MAKETNRSDCPISMSLDIWGDKWTLLIMRDLIFNNKHTYGEFLESAEGIATNILASRLKRLKSAGIIKSRPNPDNRSSTRYELTIMGIELLPILLEINIWAKNHQPVPIDVKQKIEEAEKNKSIFISEFSKQLMNENGCI